MAPLSYFKSQDCICDAGFSVRLPDFYNSEF